MPIQSFHPAVSHWFQSTFPQATSVQLKAWPHIASKQHTLLAAPTGSGKTLAAFLAGINCLIEEGLSTPLKDETRILYISPLKALSNDVQKNLQRPIEGIQETLINMGLPKVSIHAWVRTGDTPQSERQRAAKTPPHIVVTTPETAYLLLTSQSGRDMLKTVDTVIVDEIHALAGNKRGAHLSLTLERLEALVNKNITRIGCSATQKPINTIAKFLIGNRNQACHIVDTSHNRERDLQIEVPSSPLEAIMSNEVWEEVYDRLAQLAESHQSTLVFVNTRRLAERAAKHLSERLGEEHVTSHHGSLAKEHRLRAEQRLKAGELKCLIATASLELGIDIGDIDLVCQMGSPKSISAFLQRVGRSGHSVGKIPKGRLFPLSRDDLLECTALIQCAKSGLLDTIEVCDAPLDVLIQQIVAEVASNDDYDEQVLFNCFINAWPYRHVQRDTFQSLLKMLAEGYSTRRGRHGSYVHYDAINQRVRPKKGARLTALTNGGTIPDQFDYDVILSPEDIKIGTLNEDFSFESMPGDIFQLGNTSYQILRIEQRQGKVIVQDAKGQPPNLPFWIGEAPGRTDELSLAVSRLRENLESRLAMSDETAQNWLVYEYEMNASAAQQLVSYMSATRATLGAIPTQKHIFIERFFDETGDMHFIIHSPFGSRVNRAWGLSLRKKFCRRFNFELQAAALEDTIILSLSVNHSFPITEPIGYVKSSQAKETLIQALIDAPMFPTHWRWVASISLAIKRSINGKRAPAYFQRNDSEDLIAQLFPDQIACAENITGLREIPDHPLVTQAINDCLHDVMDIDGFIRVMQAIENDDIQITGKDLLTPSPLAQEIITARPYAFLDDAPAEERRALAIRSQNYLDPNTPLNDGIIDDQAMNKVKEEAWPKPTSADELHDALIVLGFFTEQEGVDNQCEPFFIELTQQNRATCLQNKQYKLWVAAERLKEFELISKSLCLAPPIAPYISSSQQPMDEDKALIEIVRSRLEGVGPTSADKLSRWLDMPASAILIALLALENEGFVVRGHFTQQIPDEEQWCERRLLARIHRYTLRRLRESVSTVSPQQFMIFLMRWQQVSDKGEGIDALSKTLNQLEGYPIAASAWESHILPARNMLYTSNLIDSLCQSGQFTWLRLAPSQPTTSHKKSSVVKNTPISLINRNHISIWRMIPEEPPNLSSSAQQLLDFIQRKGASFFSDFINHCGLLRTQVEEALGELVNAGLITSDSFEGLRALTRPNSRRPSPYTRSAYSSLGQDTSELNRAGRWSLLENSPTYQQNHLTDFENQYAKQEHIAIALLRRYGVVFRKCLERETHLPPWRDLLRIYWRMEARGDIRGGRFVSGFSGEQFALPDAVAELKYIEKNMPNDQWILLSSADPLNLTGIITPGEKIAVNTNTKILLRNGVAIAVQQGTKIHILDKTIEPNDIDIQSHFINANKKTTLRNYRRRNNMKRLF